MGADSGRRSRWISVAGKAFPAICRSWASDAFATKSAKRPSPTGHPCRLIASTPKSGRCLDSPDTHSKVLQHNVGATIRPSWALEWGMR
eukprot:3850501-Pyramimonas_sp.AAC.1